MSSKVGHVLKLNLFPKISLFARYERDNCEDLKILPSSRHWSYALLYTAMTKMMSIFLVLGLLPALASAQFKDWSEVAKQFKNAGGPSKALAQVKCFYDKHQNTQFSAPRPTDDRFNSRCYSHQTLGLGSDRYFAVIDYNKSGFSRRFFLVDRESASVESIAVAHGRYKAGYINIFNGPLKNTLKNARYFSNEIDSNASSTGFFIAAQQYSGNWGKSLVLHGLEEGINHNACERAIVVHGSDYVSLSSAKAMSSGCPMIAHTMIDRVRETLGGEKVSEDDISLVKSGGLVYIYGPREASLSDNYCEGL